ncbi:Glucan endo-1,3-beta-glucosidase 3 [Hordeum vulgare]|nr:Glucan endo-1,3-beta-glucosidase 3 [Hordeum vulgare]
MGDSSLSDDARIVGQTKQARVCGGGDHQLLRSLTNTGQEVIVTVPDSHLQHMAEFCDEEWFWVAASVAPFLPATMITHVLVGDDVLSPVSPGVDAAYSLLPAMANLHAALVAAAPAKKEASHTRSMNPILLRRLCLWSLIALSSVEDGGGDAAGVVGVARLRRTRGWTEYTILYVLLRNGINLGVQLCQ